MLLLTDEDFRGMITRGLGIRLPGLDLVRVQDVGLMHTPDSIILEWAAQHNRLLLSHDLRTMPAVIYARVSQGLPMPGVVLVNRKISVRQALDELELFIHCSFDGEWEGQAVYLPM